MDEFLGGGSWSGVSADMVVNDTCAFDKPLRHSINAILDPAPGRSCFAKVCDVTCRLYDPLTPATVSANGSRNSVMS